MAPKSKSKPTPKQTRPQQTQKSPTPKQTRPQQTQKSPTPKPTSPQRTQKSPTPKPTRPQRAQKSPTPKPTRPQRAQEPPTVSAPLAPVPTVVTPVPAPTDFSETLASDLERARELAERFYDTRALAPIINPYESQMLELLNRRQQLSDPNSTFFAAKRSADISDIMNRMRGGLEGYNAAENQAMREAMNREVEAQLATDIERARSSNAANLVLGGAAAAREDIARRGASRAKAQTEQDIFLKNIDERQRRLRDFTEMVAGTEADERRRAEEAIRGYQETLGDITSQNIGLQKERNAIEAQRRSAEAGTVTALANILGQGRSTEAQNLAMENFFKNQGKG